VKQGVSPAVAVVIIVVVVLLVALIGWRVMNPKRGGGADQPQTPEEVKAMMQKGGKMEPIKPSPAPGEGAAAGKAGMLGGQPQTAPEGTGAPTTPAPAPGGGGQ